MTENSPARLVIVPTPVGNLGDITQRAKEILQAADLVLCEDTRVTGNLLQLIGIRKPLESFNKDNEHRKLNAMMDRLSRGEMLAQVSDAGTPGISDPGFLLVRECIRAGIEVECLPGATAFVPALVVSGFPCDRFVFEGFLPQKKGRQTRLLSLKEEKRTMIFYESPHRLLKMLNELQEIFGGDRFVSISREISKKFEQTVRGTLTEMIVYFGNHAPKGEFVVVVSGSEYSVKESDDE